MARRIRLGVFVNDLLSPYQIRLFNSLKRAAEANGVRLLGFQGSFLANEDREKRTAFDGSFVYGLAGEESVDGIIIATNLLASRVGSEVVHDLCLRTRLPVVSIGHIPGIPGIEVGASDALRCVVEHVVESHKRRKIAFIQGASGNPDSIERERVVRTVLGDLGVSLPDTFVLPGDFLESSGAAAIRLLFDQRRAPLDSIDAIIASNDQMAVGAMHELMLHGLRVPNDVAVVGFDDDDFARSANPPLTTVSQPMERIGEHAIATMLRRLKGETVPERTVLGAEPVWRRSCGCARSPSARGTSGISTQPLNVALERCRDACIERYQRYASKQSNPEGIAAVIRYLTADDEQQAGPLLHDVESHITMASAVGVDALHWHDLLLPLSDEVERRASTENAVGRRMQRRMRQIGLLTNEVAARIRALEQLHTMQCANAARVLASTLLSVRHIRSLSSILSAGLPSLGIRYCCVCLFVGDAEPKVARVAALYNPTVPPPVDSPRSAEQLWKAIPGSTPPESVHQVMAGSLFPAFQLVHPKLQKSLADELSFSVYPLVYGESTLGYVVFDAPSDGQRSWLLEGLAGSLSTAVYSIERNVELKRTKEAAERANAAKTEFVAMISHEVRTPLTAIMGHIDLCLQTQLSSDLSHHLKQARNSSKALLGIVNDLLDFSRIEAQRLDLEEVPFAIDDVLDQVVATCATAVNNKGLNLVVDVQLDVPQWIRGDPLRLTQILLNLVGNAIKFSSHGDIVVGVRTSASVSEESVQLTFFVQDEGIGMRPDEVARVFQPFTQADGSMTRRFGGTGLGLTISRRLIALMRGDLTVQSEPGRGTLFEFDVTLKAHEGVPSSRASGVGRSVLVVIGQSTLSLSVERLLRIHGFQVTCVASAELALEAMTHPIGQRPGFDVMICDHDLPGLSGYHLLRRIAKEPGVVGSRVILLCRPDQKVREFDSLEMPLLGAVITKPFQRTLLLKAVTTLLRNGSSHAPTSLTLLIQPNILPPGSRILLVQDEPTTRDIVREILTRGGAKVTSTATGEDAIRLAEREEFAVVLQDIHLPGIDGFETAKAIRRLPGKSCIPIIALSASPMQQHLEKSIAAGFSDYLSLPVEPERLLQTVRIWLEGEAMAPPLSERFNCVTYSGEAPPSMTLNVPNSGAELDVERALARLGGERVVYDRLLSRFYRSHANTARNLRGMLDRRDIDSAIMVVHTLSSAAANIGATWLHETARKAEVTFREGDETRFADIQVDLELAEKRTLCAIEALLSAHVTGDVPTLEPPAGDIEEFLSHMRVMLEEHDAAVFDELEALRKILGERRSGCEAFNKLEASVGVYDFDQAKEHFEALATWICSLDSQFNSNE